MAWHANIDADEAVRVLGPHNRCLKVINAKGAQVNSLTNIRFTQEFLSSVFTSTETTLSTR